MSTYFKSRPSFIVKLHNPQQQVQHNRHTTARVVAQLGCDRGLHQHVPSRVQSVPFVGGANFIVDSAMQSYIHTTPGRDVYRPRFPVLMRSSHASPPLNDAGSGSA